MTGTDLKIPFVQRWRTALTGDPGARLVVLGNFEVERQWGRGETGLPAIPVNTATAVVNRMEEFALLLAGPGDAVVLKAPPDPGYLRYLEDLGLSLPRILAPLTQGHGRTVTEDALASPEVLHALAQLSDASWLAPHGVSEPEERLAAEAGIRLAAPPAAVCKAVNSKVYSRRMAAALGLRQPAGWACETLADLERALAWARRLLGEGRTVAIKDAFGVSGNGIAVLTEERRLGRLHRMIESRAQCGRVALVVEEWLAKTTDLNYQFTIGTDGDVTFDFVKEAITDRGVHQGHRMPARLTGRQAAELREATALIGAALASDEYYGVVGVDAMIDTGGDLYPIVEINARNNMSTYQARLHEAFAGDAAAVLARHYPVRLSAPLPFDRLRDHFAGLLFDRRRGSGLLVNNYATVNAGLTGKTVADGRLYGLVVAESADRLRILDEQICDRLTALRDTGERSTQ